MSSFLQGDDNNNTIEGTEGSDYIDGGQGKDLLYGHGGADFFLDTDGSRDLIWGGSDYDMVSFYGSDRAVQVTLGTVNIDNNTVNEEAGSSSFGDALHSIEDVEGTEFNDIIIGNDVGNYLIGAQGKDLLYGMGGDDVFIDLDGGRDLMWGGEGSDTVDYTFAGNNGHGISVNLEKGTTDQGDYLHSVENVIGTFYNDSIIGDWSDNIIDGFEGKDQMHGGGGNDTFHDSDGSRDLIWGGWAGSDTVSYEGSSTGVQARLGEITFSDWRNAEIGSSSFDDYLSGIENVTGTSYSDTLQGNYKDNIIIGGAGRDYLSGGDGADMFKYEAISDSVATGDMNDKIFDFKTGEDMITLDFDVNFADIAISAHASSFNEVTIAGSDFSVFVAGDIALSDIIITA